MSDHQTQTEADQAPVIDFFARDAQRIDTQGAVVLLKGDTAIKIRRAIRLPFLDYSTLDKRRAAAEAEIALNRDNAPHIYIEASPIVSARDGFTLGGEGEIVEWATRMRRFDENATFDKIAARGEVKDAHVRDLARAVRASHERAQIREARPFIEAAARWIAQNSGAFAERPDLFPTLETRELAERSRAALEAATPLLLARGNLQRIRRCHGDLHLGNIVLSENRPTLFDAIEFDETIATGDVLYDLAFAVMDLWERDLRTEASLLLNSYLALSDAEDYSGLALMPLFLALRAAIRAKVEAANLAHLDAEKRETAAKSARRYFDFAARFLEPAPACLVAIGGLSGVGKSAVAHALSPEIGRAPGAALLRSDVERKHLHGVDEMSKLPDEAYGAEAGRETYARLIDKARRALEAGASALVDATFARGAERAAIAEIARTARARFVGLWLDARLETRLKRIGARRADASDADAAVALKQRCDPLSESGWLAVDASGDFAAALANARVALAKRISV